MFHASRMVPQLCPPIYIVVLKSENVLFLLKVRLHEKLHKRTWLLSDKFGLVAEYHGVRRIGCAGIPVWQILTRHIFPIWISRTDEVGPIITHLASQVVMFADKRPPTLSQSLEEKPQINRMKGPWLIPPRNFRIEYVIVQWLLRLPVATGLYGGADSKLQGMESGFFQNVFEIMSICFAKRKICCR